MSAFLARPRVVLALNLGFVVAMMVLATVAAWPIYQSVAFLILAAVATALGIGIPLLARWRSWNGWIVTGLVAGSFLVLGVPLAVPSALAGFPQFVSGVGQLVAGVVVGWKEIVTISIPLGSYQATLVPALVVFLIGATVATVAVLRTGLEYLAAVGVLLTVQGFGLVFGSSVPSEPLVMGGVSVIAPRELVVGLLAFALSLFLLIWRTWLRRTAALAASQRVSGIRNVAHSRASTVRRITLAAAMFVAAVLVGISVAPALAADQTRDVLRSAVDPYQRVQTLVSPLSTLRDYYTDERFDEQLFTIETDADVERMRIATLSYYDGEAFRVGPVATTDQGLAFSRVPYTLTPDDDTGDRASLSLSIASYRGPMVPSAGDLVAISFAGDRPQALGDAFFYNPSLAAGIELADGGLREGDAYELVVQRDADTGLTELTPATAGPTEADAAVIPASLVEWVKQQEVPATAEGLQVLIERLRARGYLSHDLDAPEAGGGTRWVSALDSYTFEPSRPGHSVDRISGMFTALLDKQAEVGANDDDALLVAAIGDDEQFATAAALLARQFGFDSRVVVGVRLTAELDSGVLACDGSSCTGANVAAWVEIGGGDGRWATVDVTPQYRNTISPDLTVSQDPKNPTEVEPVAAEPVAPEIGQAAGDETAESDATGGLDLAWLWTTLRILGTVLLIALIVCAPVILVVGAKWVRRRQRRQIADPAQRITAGWEEFVDTALDFGRPAVANPTRQQVAAVYSTPQATALATAADRAVFGGVTPLDEEGEQFWQIVEAERLAFAQGLTRRQQLRSLLSLRSFTYRIDLGSLIRVRR